MAKRMLLLTLATMITLGGAFMATADGIPAEKAAAEKAALDAGTMKVWKPGDPMVKQVKPRNVGPSPREANRGGMVTIQYDDGVMTGVASVASFTNGNRFDTHMSNPLAASGSITAATFYLATVTGSAAWVSFYDQLNTGAATANPVNSANITGRVAGWNTVATGHSYVGNSVLGGIWYSGDQVAFGTGTNAGQGHHGMVINDGGGNSYSALGTVNALFRISGNPLPVELMSFEIE